MIGGGLNETVTLIAKQQRMKGRSLALQVTRPPVSVAKAPKVTATPTASPSTSKLAKPIDEGILEDLIKGIQGVEGRDE